MTREPASIAGNANIDVAYSITTMPIVSAVLSLIAWLMRR